MDNQHFFRALFWALLVFLVWSMVARQIWPPPPPPVDGTQSAAPGVTPGGGADVPAAAGVDVGSGGLSVAAAEPVAAAAGGMSAVSAAAGQRFVLGSTDEAKKSPYRMHLALTNAGAGVVTADLSDHQQKVDDPARYRVLRPLEETAGTIRSLMLESVVIDGQPLDLKGVMWQGEAVTVDGTAGVRFTTTIEAAGEPLLAIERTYTLPAQSVDLHRSDLQLVETVRNLSAKPRQVILNTLGPVGFSSDSRFMPDRKVYSAMRQDGVMRMVAKNFKEIGKAKTYKLYPENDGQREPLVWTGAGNLYFTCTLAPVGTDGQDPSGQIASVMAIDLDDNAETDHDATVRITTRPIPLPPQGEATLRTAIYLGAKDRYAFEDEQNADYVARNYMAQIKEGYGSCTFNFLTDIMIGLLNKLFRLIPNFGVAIILLVVIVRTLLHPITKRTQVNMVKMQQSMAVLQPRMDEIKKRHKGDNKKIQEEMMKLYREEGTSPFGQMFTCLPMLLQMPIWIALYSSLRNNVLMRGEGFVFWVNDLTAPDCLYRFAEPIPLPIVKPLECINLLPVLVGILMFAQQKLMPKPKSMATVQKTPQQEQAEQMQKIMPFMSFIMIFIFYPFPSGLNLYIMASSLIGTAEQLYIRSHISKQDLQGSTEKKAAKASWWSKWFTDMQKRAEEAQKKAPPRRGKRGR